MNCACCDISIGELPKFIANWQEQFCGRCAIAIRKIALNNLDNTWLTTYNGKPRVGVLEFTGAPIYSAELRRLEFKKSDILMVTEIEEFVN